MLSRTRATPRGRTTSDAVASLALVAALVGGCSGGSDDPSTPSDDPSGTGTVPPAGGEGDGTVGTGMDDAGEENAGEENAGADPEVTNVVPFGSDDDPGVLVTSLGPGASVEDESAFLVFVDLFALESRPDGNGSAFVELIRFESPLTFSALVDFYTDDYIGGLDDCLIRDLDEEGGGGGRAEPDPLLVAGGEVLTISTAAGTFGDIPRIDGPRGIAYDADATLPGPMPDDAVLSIPGGDFPTVEAFPLGPVPPGPVRLSPDRGEALSSATRFRWEPTDAPDYVRLSFLARTAAGDFRGFPVSCFARDDGEFELPDEAVEALSSSTDVISLRYARMSARLEPRDGIAFFVTSETAE